MLAHLSNIELYYSSSIDFSGEMIKLTEEEFHHAVKVMRHKPGDVLYITDGNGSIFECSIISIGKKEISAKIIETIKSENNFKNIYFCISKLKNPDRFKFALEKCVELGVVNFLIFESDRTVSKGTNLKRWEKIVLSAMKQSLRAFLPEIKILKSISEIVELSGRKIVFEQNSEKQFIAEKLQNENHYLIFGPEGGLTKNELEMIGFNSQYSLSFYRLRSETAIVKAASLLNHQLV